MIACLLLPALAGGQVVDQLSQRRARDHYLRGEELLLSERYEQAVAEFTTATDLDPLLMLAHYGRGQAYMALKRYASAVQAFLDGRKAFETIAALRQNKLGESQRLEADEINELRDSMRRMTSEVEVNALARARIEQRLHELAVLRRGSNFGEVLLVPAELSLALGSAYYRNGQAQDAERAWTEAVTTNPRLGEAHNNLAVLYLTTGRKKEAQEAVKAAERGGFRVHPQLKADIQKMK